MELPNIKISSLQGEILVAHPRRARFLFKFGDVKSFSFWIKSFFGKSQRGRVFFHKAFGLPESHNPSTWLQHRGIARLVAS